MHNQPFNEMLRTVLLDWIRSCRDYDGQKQETLDGAHLESQNEAERKQGKQFELQTKLEPKNWLLEFRNKSLVRKQFEQQQFNTDTLFKLLALHLLSGIYMLLDHNRQPDKRILNSVNTHDSSNDL